MEIIIVKYLYSLYELYELGGTVKYLLWKVYQIKLV